MHQTLYRKYRPKKFSDIVGQDHIKDVLRGAVASGKIGHAYLFAGSRGTGKTTAARILAQTANCLNPQNGEACGTCENCQLIMADKALDIIEIDAASNRGIDEIRDLRERVRFQPTHLKKKIYIIDEVHMLTNEAFNALLKTLEEPPEHSLFILATTEGHKVPMTIQSRSQRLNFQLGTLTQIYKHLKNIAQQEQVDIEDDALKIIALVADGGYRDALSALEQVMTKSGKITADDVRAILGLAEEKTVNFILKSIFSGDQKKAAELLDELHKQGASAVHVHRLLIESLRRSLRAALGVEDLPETVKGDQNQIIKILEALVEITPTIRTSPLPFLPIEIVLAKNCLPPLTSSQPSHSLTSLQSSPSTHPSPTTSSPSSSPLWPQVLEELKSYNHSLTYLLKDAQIEQLTDKEITIGLRYKFHVDRVMEQKNHQAIENAIEKVYGQKLRLICKPSSPSDPSSSSSSEDLAQAAEEILGV